MLNFQKNFLEASGGLTSCEPVGLQIHMYWLTSPLA